MFHIITVYCIIDQLHVAFVNFRDDFQKPLKKFLQTPVIWIVVYINNISRTSAANEANLST